MPPVRRGQSFLVDVLHHFSTAWMRVVLLTCFQLAHYENQALAFEAPAFQADVLDEAGILSSPDKAALLNRIHEMRESTGIWAAIYVARGLQNDSIESASVATFEKWKLGQTGKDNGLLILIVPSEKKIRIEVGYGLEGFITDALSKRVIDEIYKPAFRDHRYAKGLLQGFAVMERVASGEHIPIKPDATPSASSSSPRPNAEWTRMPRYFGLTLSANLAPPFLYLLALIYGRSKGRREVGSLWNSARVPFIVASVLGVIFGILVAVFGALSVADPEVMKFFVAANMLFASLSFLPFAFKARRFLFASVNRRHLARERLFRIRKRSKNARKIFGILFEPSMVSVSHGGTRCEPRNFDDGFTSKSSSSSHSSSNTSPTSSWSSGGGRSGGGGSSGSW